MKLQIAFNSTDLEKDLDVAKQIYKFADFIEIGPLLLYKYGASAIEQFRKALPDSSIIADTKIAEYGADSAKVNLEAGADWITVLAGANKNTIHATCTAAREMGKRVMIDLIDARSKGQSALEAKSYGADAIIFHQSYDDHDQDALMDEWDMVKGNASLPIYISAQINRENLQNISTLAPEGIAIGKAITAAEDPAKEAEYFKNILN